MRRFLAVLDVLAAPGPRAAVTATACAAALTAASLPLAAPASAAPAAARTARPPATGAPPDAPAALPEGVPGATQSLPLVTLGAARRAAGAPAGAEVGLPERAVKPFSLVGIVWDDATKELRGRAWVRTRAVGSRVWSGWQDIQTHDDDRPDPDSAEGRGRRLRGASAPLWVGASDAVQLRVSPETATGRTPEERALPGGLRLELVDPGADPKPSATRPAGAAKTPPRGPARPPRPQQARPQQPKGQPVRPQQARPQQAKPQPARPQSPAVQRPAIQRPAVQPPTGRHPVAQPPKDRPPQAQRPRTRSAAAPPDPSEEEFAASAVNAPLAPLGATEIPALDKRASVGDIEHTDTGGAPLTDETEPDGTGDPYAAADDDQDGRPGYGDIERYVGPRPRIVTRAGWGADESLRESGFRYTKSVKVAFVHHTATGNTYSCSQTPSVIRSMYRYHVVSSGWRDIGYNFLVDKCGTVYEGRAGGVAKPVMGAHTLGFNTNSMGIAVIGTFNNSAPSDDAVDAVARLSAWKVGLFGGNPRGTATLVSGGGNLFKKGTRVKLKVISGHRDGYATDCPGDRLYGRLGTARTEASRLQGR
ncbi:N-acetylmuramoyl-L-alanine amidase [Streptomyces gamaensis]|uniref:N-acetylmuramoyl-L-alanine amidase n=1 Tax=Streptomyces gamaensis TaxID=1763542 RepID=A0ABW0Z4F6_9ACTN